MLFFFGENISFFLLQLKQCLILWSVAIVMPNRPHLHSLLPGYPTKDLKNFKWLLNRDLEVCFVKKFSKDF